MVAVVVLALWTAVVALGTVPVPPEYADEGVSAQYVWLGSAAALVVPGLVAALAVAARLSRYGAGAAQLALVTLVVGLGPHLALLAALRLFWWVARPAGVQGPLPLRPDPSESWSGLVLGSTGRLAVLVLVAVLLGVLAGRLGARGAVLLPVAAAPFVLVPVLAAGGWQGPGGAAYAWYAPVVVSLRVLLTGRPEEHVRVGGDCGPLGAVVCGDVVGAAGAAAHLALPLLLLALLVVVLSGPLALLPRRRGGRSTVRA